MVRLAHKVFRDHKVSKEIPALPAPRGFRVMLDQQDRRVWQARQEPPALREILDRPVLLAHREFKATLAPLALKAHRAFKAFKVLQAQLGLLETLEPPDPLVPKASKA